MGRKFESRLDAGRQLARALGAEFDVVLVRKFGAPQSLEAIRPHAEELICLEAPVESRAVGQFYRNFTQVEDDEVVTLPARSAQTATHA